MTASELPKVTIGLPTFNRLEYLKAALASALNQTYQNIEIVLSDNASPDGTWEYVKTLTDPRLVLLRQDTNVGGIPNLNACLSAATGELFLLLSDDDLLAPTAIESLATPFLRPDGSLDPAVGLTWCTCRIIDSAGNPQWATAAGPAVESPASLLTELFRGERGPRLSSVLVRTADARRAGGYNLERYDAMCDTANWGTAALPYPKAVCIPRALVSYRVHSASHTAASLVSDWQRWGGRMHDDLFGLLSRHGTAVEIRRFRRSRSALLANLTVDVLMRSKGSPGFVGKALREAWRSRRFMLTPYVALRFVREGYKLLGSTSSKS